MNNEEVDALMCDVLGWLTEENNSRHRWCRAAKLELLMKNGMVTPAEANDCWELSAGK